MGNRLKQLSLLAAAVAVSLCTASTASAANVVPNPGFETACSGDPCDWSAHASASIDRVTTNAHVGANMQVTTTLSNSGARSACVNTMPTGPTVTESFWYRTSDTNVGSVVMGGIFHTGAGCTGTASGSGNSATPIRDGQWHHQSLTISIPAGTASVIFFLQHTCSTCAGGVTVFYDEVVFNVNPPTAVSGAVLGVHRSLHGVLIRWRTGSGGDELGFNVYRAQHGKLVKLNRTLIPSRFGRTASSHAYSWLDRNAPRSGSVRYRLQAVSLSGKRSWIGGAVASR
jgi:hypothetical protein